MSGVVGDGFHDHLIYPVGIDSLPKVVTQATYQASLHSSHYIRSVPSDRMVRVKGSK